MLSIPTLWKICIWKETHQAPIHSPCQRNRSKENYFYFTSFCNQKFHVWLLAMKMRDKKCRRQKIREKGSESCSEYSTKMKTAWSLLKFNFITRSVCGSQYLLKFVWMFVSDSFFDCWGVMKEDSQLCPDPWAISNCFFAIRLQSVEENEKICKATSSDFVFSPA